jgi:hypothetical protein
MSMFANLGLHIIKNPAGTYSYVGSIPVSLGYEVPADRSAVMGGRSFRNAEGKLVEWEFPVFKTEQEAKDFAISKGAMK